MSAPFSAARAAPWVLDPLFDAEAGYDSNVRLRESGREDTFQVSSSVGLRGESYTDERQVRFEGEAGYTMYQGGDDAPEDGDFQSFTSRAIWQQERTQWQLDSRALRDNTIVSVTELLAAEDPDAEIDPGSDIDGRSIDETVTRYRLFLSPSFQHDLTERASFGGSYVGRYLDFEHGGIENVASLNHQFELRTDYDFTERMSAGVAAQSWLFRPSGDLTASNSYGVSADLSYDFSPRSTLTASGGVRHTEPHRSESDAESGTGFVGGMRFRHRAENWWGSASLERRLLPNNRGVLTETDQLIVSATRELSPRWEVSAIGRAFTVRGVNDDLSAGTTKHFVSARPQLLYRLTQAWSLTADYRYEAERRIASDRTADVHSVFLGIEYSPPRQFPRF